MPIQLRFVQTWETPLMNIRLTSLNDDGIGRASQMLKDK